MTVLHYLGYDDDRGGIVSAVRALAAAHRFTCVLGVNEGFVQRRFPPLATLELPSTEGERISPRTLWRARAVAHAVRTWLQAEPGRVFHGHSRAGLLVALWLTRAGEQNVVASVHCYGRQRWFYRWAAQRLDARLVWLTPAMKRYYGVDHGGSWSRCIPPCIPESVPRLRAAATARDPRGVVRFCGAGLLVAWKRWDLMLDALAVVPETIRQRVHFTHLGGEDGTGASRAYAAALRARTTALGLEGQVEWRGEQPAAQAAIAGSDCAVVLSRQEPFSMVMLEALAAGVPVLASAAGGPSDVIQPGVNGWLFRPDDVADLARQLQLLVDGDALQRAEVTREHLRRFEPDTIAGQWAEVYAQLGLQPATASQ